MHQVEDGHDTPLKKLSATGLVTAVVVVDQVPLCKASASGSSTLEGPMVCPTAMQKPPRTQDTPQSASSVLELAEDMIDHDVPFHCSARVWPPWYPEAMHTVFEVHDTARNSLCDPGLAAATVVQDDPFHRSAKGRFPAESTSPAAMHQLEERHDTPKR
jgi:hypothetical protein